MYDYLYTIRDSCYMSLHWTLGIAFADFFYPLLLFPSTVSIQSLLRRWTGQVSNPFLDEFARKIS